MTDEITFALDIGTRTIVGILIKESEKGYKIIHSAVRRSKRRAGRNVRFKLEKCCYRCGW